MKIISKFISLIKDHPLIYAVDELFNSDEHSIISKKGVEILNTLSREELKELVEKHKNI